MNLTRRFRAGFAALAHHLWPKYATAALALLLVPSLAQAQSTPVYQSGQMIAPHNLAKITRNGQIQDVGGLSGDNSGRGVNPFSVTDSLGLGQCLSSANTSGQYNALCLGHDSSGNGLISLDSYGGLGAKSLSFRLNGTTYSFPGAGNGDVAGPGSSVDSNIPAFNGTGGKTLKDSGIVVHGVPAAAGDGSANDSAAITAVLSAMPAAGGTLQLNSSKKYRIGTSITLPPNVTLDCGQAPGFQDSSGSLNGLGGLRVDSSATINMGPGSRITHCPIYRTGATFPIASPAAYAGTAITYPTGSTPDTYLVDVLIVGFAVCVDQSNQADRFHWINVECDGTAGYKIGPSLDTSEMRIVRAWPWGTANAVSPTLTRSGTGFLFTGSGRTDDLKVSGILDFGHATAIDIENGGGSCCNIHFENVWTDNNATAAIVNKAGNVSFGKVWIFQTGGVGIDLNANARTVVDQLFIQDATDAIKLQAGAGLVLGYGDFNSLSGRVANIVSNSSFLQIKGGYLDTTTVATTPYIAVPSGLSSHRLAVNLTLGSGVRSNLIGSTAQSPLYGWGDQVGQTAGITAPTAVIAGPGQTTPNLAQGGALGGSLLLKDTNSAAGSGGCLLYGANGSHMRHFACIKGSLVSGSNNTVGDIDIATRVTDTDAALTDALHIDHSGYVQMRRTPTFATLAACAAGTAGSIQPVSDSNTVTWGANIAGGGANTVMGFCNGTNWTVMAK